MNRSRDRQTGKVRPRDIETDRWKNRQRKTWTDKGDRNQQINIER